MRECTFCKIVNHEIPTVPVFEGNGLIVIKDIEPKAPVHLLIIPMRHIANLDDVTEDEARILSNILLKAKDLASELGVSGRYKVVTNVGELAGQTIFHMHFHLLGGWEKIQDVESQLTQ